MEDSDLDQLLADITKLSNIPKHELYLKNPDEITIPEPGDTELFELKQNEIRHALLTIKSRIEARIILVAKLDEAMNTVDYQMSEIHAEFRVKMDELKNRKDIIIGDSLTEIEELNITTQLEAIDQEITEIENMHQSQIHVINERKLAAQTDYENVSTMLDSSLDMLKKYYEHMLFLVEAQKVNAEGDEIVEIEKKYLPITEQYKKDIEFFTGLQVRGWRTEDADVNITKLLESRGLKLTQSGMILTSSGRILTKQQAQEENLLIGINLSKLEIDQGEELFLGEAEAKASSTSVVGSSSSSKISSDDMNYLKVNLGLPLTLALAEITAKQPKDPIHYLGHWLFKYRYNQQTEETNKAEVEALTEERNRLAKEVWHKFLEEEARNAVLAMIVRAEEVAALNEFRRIEREAAAAEEEENFDDEARDVMGVYNGPSTNPQV